MCVGSKNLSNSTIDENNICWDSVYSIMMDGQFDFYIGIIIIPPECKLLLLMMMGIFW